MCDDWYLLVGVAGVAALVGIDVGSIDLPSVALLRWWLCYAVGPMIQAARLAEVPPLGVVAASVTLCALIYLPVGRPGTHVAVGQRRASLGTGVHLQALAFVVFFALIGSGRCADAHHLRPRGGDRARCGSARRAAHRRQVVGFVLVLLGSCSDVTAGTPTDVPEPSLPGPPLAGRRSLVGDELVHRQAPHGGDGDGHGHVAKTAAARHGDPSEHLELPPMKLSASQAPQPMPTATPRMPMTTAS